MAKKKQRNGKERTVVKFFCGGNKESFLHFIAAFIFTAFKDPFYEISETELTVSDNSLRMQLLEV